MTSQAAIDFLVLGARGGCPVSGAQTLRYGGDTTCFALETEQALLVFDAGTGIRTLNARIAQWKTPKPIALFFTHFHLDHVAALAMFQPLYDPAADITLYGTDPHPHHPWRDALHHLITEPYWPVPLPDVPACLQYRDLDAHDHHVTIAGIEVRWRTVNHTQTCLAYRIQLPGGSITLAPDQELALDDPEACREFAAHTDFLLQDAQYTPEEYPHRQGWGHSTWLDAAKLAANAHVQHLVLFHHDPGRTDAQIDAITTNAQSVFPRTLAASPSFHIHFPTPSSPPTLITEPAP